MKNLTETLEKIYQLPATFHKVGILGEPVLRAITDYAAEMDIRQTAETGSGQSTLLFSNISPSHKVFALDMVGGADTQSISAVQQSELLETGSTEYIIGPTQTTLPAYRFTSQLDIVLLDGPHAYPFPELEYYYLYPHLRQGGLLVIDDIHIPSIANMFSILCEDDMFVLENVIYATGFLRRTSAPVFPPDQDNWWLQGYNNERRKADVFAVLQNYQYEPGNHPFAAEIPLEPDADTARDEPPAVQQPEPEPEDFNEYSYLTRLNYVLYTAVALLISQPLAISLRKRVRSVLGRKPLT